MTKETLQALLGMTCSVINALAKSLALLKVTRKHQNQKKNNTVAHLSVLFILCVPVQDLHCSYFIVGAPFYINSEHILSTWLPS